MTRDLYEVLEIPRDATQEDVKRAYRRLARAFHPDVSNDPEAEHKIKEINLAYQTLSDPQKRRQYDLYGGAGFTPDMFSFMGDISDIFEAFFGSPFGRARTRTPPTRTRRGGDLRTVLGLTFEEAAFGTKKDVEVRTLVTCDRCGGDGAEPGTEPTRCRDCGGSGQLSEVRRSVFGTVMTSRTCPRCEGTGQEIAHPCDRCGGSGRLSETQTLSIQVPAGVADGMELRIEGRGQAGRNAGPPGDLYIALQVRPHPLFERHGQDLVCTLELPLVLALLGAEVKIPSLEGEEIVRLPPGTTTGTVIRLRGLGLPNPGRRGRGDLHVEVEVLMPQRLSKKERQLVEQLAELSDEGPTRGPVEGRLRARDERRG
jgi:molecular chaperone DnaJ